MADRPARDADLAVREVRAALLAREAADHGLRIRRVFIAAAALPASMPLTYAHPLVESADFDGFETLAGTQHRI